MPELKIMPSILAAHPGRLEEGCVAAERAGADLLHLDIMDGHFVPNLSFGPAVVAMAKEAVGLPLNVHLMVTRPDELADAFLDAGADTLLIHAEARATWRATLAHIRRAGCAPASPSTPRRPRRRRCDFGEAVDEVLCMTVHPGFGGQSFIAGGPAQDRTDPRRAAGGGHRGRRRHQRRHGGRLRRRGRQPLRGRDLALRGRRHGATRSNAMRERIRAASPLANGS